MPKDTEIHNHIIAIIESEHFSDKVVKYTRKTCQEIIDRIMRRIWLIGSPLVAAIVALILYIFNVTNTTVDSLAHSTMQLDTTVKLLEQSIGIMDERTRNNAKSIDIIDKRQYDLELWLKQQQR